MRFKTSAVATVLAITLVLAEMAFAQAATTNTKSPREVALEALSVLKSAMDGGAGYGKFTKYYLHAKTEVDALPDGPENQDIRRVSTVYSDASSLWGSWSSGYLSPVEVSRLKVAYKDEGVTSLNQLPDTGFGAVWMWTGTETLTHTWGETALWSAVIRERRAVQTGRYFARRAAFELIALAGRGLGRLK